MNEKITVSRAIKSGDWKVKLSTIIMGFGCMARKQIVKGIGILLIEVGFIYYMLTKGFYNLSMLPSLGWRKQQEVWNEAKGVYEYTKGDMSVLLLLYGIATIFLIVAFILFWRIQIKQCYKLYKLERNDLKIPTLKEDFKSMFDKNLHVTLMSLPMLGIITFNILPLIFMISMAFTSYSKEGDHTILFDWIGFENFARVLNLGGNIGRQFWHVAGWTLVWAFFATFLNYFLGMILALIINRKETKIKGFWRFCFVLTIAVPQFVTLLIMSTMLQEQGAVNVLLKNMGFITKALPFFQQTTWARITVVVVNLWVGIPYTMLQVTGILQNIPADLYEAAKIDGAGPVATFFKITLPYMLFVTTPYLITTFTGNINNFNVIYLLSGGNPIHVGDTAGQTDLLVTWLYKLTIDQQYYNLGAVIGILSFILLSVVSLVTYRNSKSYKNEEAFR